MAEINYNSNKDLDLDGKMMVAIGGIPIAFATSAKITITTDMVDTTNMMSGDWKDEIPGIKSFTVTSEALITQKTGAVSADVLVEGQLKDSLLEFTFGNYKRSGDETTGYTYALDTTKTSYTGSMRISSMELNGENSKLKKYSMNANGCGPLTMVAAVAGA